MTNKSSEWSTKKEKKGSSNLDTKSYKKSKFLFVVPYFLTNVHVTNIEVGPAKPKVNLHPL